MTLPNFLIIGAQKAGSTWLAANLRQHPEVFMPRQELHFFDKDYNFQKGVGWYRRKFDNANGFKAVGEKTPDYLWANGVGAEGHLPEVHKNIYDVLGDVRLIILLRNPVDRAISAANHIVRSGRVSPFIDMDDLLVGKQQHRMAEHGVIDYGYYYRQIVAYQEFFPREKMLILIFEDDVIRNSIGGLRKACQFLDIDPHFTFPDKGSKKNEYKASMFGLALGYYLPYGKQFARLIDPFKPYRQRPANGTRQLLQELYREENEKLFELLGREIDAWQPTASG